MNEREFSRMLAKIECEFEEGSAFVDIVEEMMELLDDADYGSGVDEGSWRELLGWE
jgi:hypothetical protein